MSALKITAIAGSLLFAISAMALATRTADSRTIKLQENEKVNSQATNQSKLKPTATDQKQGNQKKRKREPMGEDKMQFGNFSVSLAVKDIKASKAFYEKLDFQQVFGNVEQNFVIMQNGTTVRPTAQRVL